MALNSLVLQKKDMDIQKDMNSFFFVLTLDFFFLLRFDNRLGPKKAGRAREAFLNIFQNS